MNTKAPIVLSVEQLTKRFGNTLAVAGIDLTIREGECLALLGPNGAGKTSTCEMLEGLLSPDSGNIRIFGKNYIEHRNEILENIGVQLQETNLYKKYTVWETLQLFASFYQHPGPIEPMLIKLDLLHKRNSRLEHLSGGEKQKVYLGCALIHQPKLVFLDEPTAGLDPHARRLIWDIIEDIKHENRSILLTTHYMEEAERLADRVAVVDHGKIIAVDSPKNLISHYCGGEAWGVAFEGAGQGLNLDVWQVLTGELSWLKHVKKTSNGFEAVSENAGTHIQGLMLAIEKFKLKIASLYMRKATLEDVFLSLTGRSFKGDNA